MKTALSHAAGFISSSDGLDEVSRTCIECGEPLESWESSRCSTCIRYSIETVKRNSNEWMSDDEHPVIAQARRREARQRDNWGFIAYKPTCDGIVMRTDCPLYGSQDCADYQEHLQDVGRGDDPYPTQWDAQTAEVAGAFTPRCDH